MPKHANVEYLGISYFFFKESYKYINLKERKSDKLSWDRIETQTRKNATITISIPIWIVNEQTLDTRIEEQMDGWEKSKL